MSISDEAIYKEHSGELVGYASALVGSADGPDLLSIVVTKVLARGRLSDLDSPKRYLLRAISNEAKSHHRQRSRRQLVGFAAGAAVPPPESDVVFEAVMDLPVRQRSATYLVYWLGYQPNDAAGVMGCRPATVRRYLHLARRRLEEVLDALD